MRDLNPPCLVAMLVHYHARLVPYMLRPWQRDPYYEDMMSEGRSGLIDAARRWDPDRGKFASIACHMIVWRALRYRRRAAIVVVPGPERHYLGHVVSLDTPISDDAVLADVVSDPLAEISSGAALDSQIIRRAIFHWLRGLKLSTRRACIASMRGRRLTKTQHNLIDQLRHNPRHIARLRRAIT